MLIWVGLSLEMPENHTILCKCGTGTVKTCHVLFTPKSHFFAEFFFQKSYFIRSLTFRRTEAIPKFSQNSIREPYFICDSHQILLTCQFNFVWNCFMWTIGIKIKCPTGEALAICNAILWYTPNGVAKTYFCRWIGLIRFISSQFYSQFMQILPTFVNFAI